MKAKKAPAPEVQAAKFTKEDARRKLQAIQELMASPGYKWLSDEVKQSRTAWQKEMLTKKPVGEGAADIARAQGAIIMATSVLEHPKNTAASLVDYISKNTELAGYVRPEDDEEESDD